MSRAVATVLLGLLTVGVAWSNALAQGEGDDGDGGNGPKGSITVQTDDVRDPAGGSAGNLVTGATLKLVRTLDQTEVETVCVTDDSAADSSTGLAAACSGTDGRAVDDENDAGGVIEVSGLTLGSWTISEVGLPEGFEADSCTTSNNSRSVVLTDSQPDASAAGQGCGPTSAFHNPAEGEGGCDDGGHDGGGDEGDCGGSGGSGGKQVTIMAYAAVCDSFDVVPRNPGAGTSDNDADHAGGPVDETSPVQAGAPLPAGCHLASGAVSGESFSFNYSLDGEMVTHPNATPVSGVSFGSPTGAGGFTSIVMARHNFAGTKSVWVSEVPAANFAFAGLRCYDDIQNQDNSESIHLIGGKGQPHPPGGIPKSETVYCMAYNVGLGTLQLVKHDDVDAAHGGNSGTWDFTISGPAAFDPKTVSVSRSAGGTVQVFAASSIPTGTYHVTETNGNGLACADQDPKTFQTGIGTAGNVQVSTDVVVAAGATTIVDIYNTDCSTALGSANLRVIAIADRNGNKAPDAGDAEIEGVAITLSCSSQPDVHLQTSPKQDGHVAADFKGLPNNALCTVAQATPQGYTIVGWQSTDTTGPAKGDGSGTSTAIHMDDGDMNTVTFFNEPVPMMPPPNIILPIQVVIPPVQPETPIPTLTPEAPTTPVATQTPTATETPVVTGTPVETENPEIVLGEKTPGPAGTLIATPAAPSTGSGSQGEEQPVFVALLAAAAFTASAGLALLSLNRKSRV